MLRRISEQTARRVDSWCQVGAFVAIVTTIGLDDYHMYRQDQAAHAYLQAQYEQHVETMRGISDPLVSQQEQSSEAPREPEQSF